MHLDVTLREFRQPGHGGPEGDRPLIQVVGEEGVEVRKGMTDMETGDDESITTSADQEDVRRLEDPDFVCRMREFLQRRRKYLERLEERRRTGTEGEGAKVDGLPELEVISVEYLEEGKGMDRKAGLIGDRSTNSEGHKRFLEMFYDIQKRKSKLAMKDQLGDMLSNDDDGLKNGATELEKIRFSLEFQQRMIQQMKKAIRFQSDKLVSMRECFMMAGKKIERSAAVDNDPEDMEKLQLQHTLDNLRELYEMEVLRRQDLEAMLKKNVMELNELRSMVDNNDTPSVVMEEEDTRNPAIAKGLAQGDELMELGRYPEAAEVLEDLLERHPGHPVILNALGVALFSMGEHERALRFFEKAIEENPKHEEAWVNRGFLLLDIHEIDPAKESFRNALLIDPDSKDAWEGLMECEGADA